MYLGFQEDLVNEVNYRYNYDLSDRLVKVSDTKGNTLTYGYDKDNNVDKVTEKIGTETYVTSYTFDNDNRIKTITIPKSANTISYAYDSIGRLKTSTIVIGTSQFVTTNNYDAGKTIKYYYNELNELIREDNQVLDKTVAYSYDAGGNILNKIEYAYTTDAVLSNPVNTISYTYGDDNWKDKLTAYDGKTITYDGYTYTWEEGRQLKTISGNGLDISFKYNSGGIRTEKKAGNIITNYHLIGDKVTFEYNGADKIYYTYGNDGDLVSMNLNDVEYYYIRNAQGDIIGLLDGSGTEVVSYVYDSWGKLISTTGTLKDTVGAKNPYRYRGYRYDTETGLYYLQSRYYNPEWGRFINADAILGQAGQLLSHNVFAYCLNNPVNMVDPDGNIAWWIIGGGIGAVAGGAIGAYKSYKAYGKVKLSYVLGGVAVGALAGAGLGWIAQPTVVYAATMGYKISEFANDWISKGFHIKIDGIELSMKPGTNGSIVFKTVFSSTPSRAAQKAIDKAYALLKDPSVRQDFLNAAIKG